MTAPDRQTLAGDEALSLLVDVYMSGFSTGYGSALATYFTDVPDGVRDQDTQTATRAMRSDPLAMDVVATEIGELFEGVDSGPKAFTIQEPT